MTKADALAYLEKAMARASALSPKAKAAKLYRAATRLHNESVFKSGYAGIPKDNVLHLGSRIVGMCEGVEMVLADMTD